MAEEILLSLSLNKDNLSQKKNDHEVICRLDIEPSMSYRSQHEIVPCDICLVLDSSGSMKDSFAAGNPITKRQAVINAAKGIIPNLNKDDTVSLTFYGSKAYNPAVCLPASSRREIEQKIDSLTFDGGATNFEAALKEARTALNKGNNASKRIVFLTDGLVNTGSEKTVKQLVNEFAQQSVVIDSLGVGSDFDFSYMRGLSGPSNGRTFHLDNPDEGKNRFEELLVNAQKVIATNVFLTALFPKGLRDIEVFQWLPEQRYYGELIPNPDGQTRLEVNVQTLRQDKRNIFLFKANLDSPATDHIQLYANIRLDFDLPPLNKTGLQENLKIYVNFMDDDTNTEYDPELDNNYREVELSKLYEQLEKYRKNDWQKAVTIINEMINRANMLGDSKRIKQYEKNKKKLQLEHGLSDEDMIPTGVVSSVSTQAAEGDLQNSNEDDILNAL